MKASRGSSDSVGIWRPVFMSKSGYATQFLNTPAETTSVRCSSAFMAGPPGEAPSQGNALKLVLQIDYQNYTGCTWPSTTKHNAVKLRWRELEFLNRLRLGYRFAKLVALILKRIVSELCTLTFCRSPLWPMPFTYSRNTPSIGRPGRPRSSNSL